MLEEIKAIVSKSTKHEAIFRDKLDMRILEIKQ